MRHIPPVWILSLLTLSACADQRIPLRYGMLPSGAADTTQALTLDGAIAPWLDVAITDVRVDTSDLGSVASGLSVFSRGVRASTPASEYVRDAVRYELWNAGYGTTAERGRIVVRGAIDRLELSGGSIFDRDWCEAYVSLTLVAERDGVRLVGGTYGGSHAVREEQPPREGTIRTVLDVALGWALLRFVEDLRRTVR